MINDEIPDIGLVYCSKKQILHIYAIPAHKIKVRLLYNIIILAHDKSTPKSYTFPVSTPTTTGLKI